jgi:hypothetical protein
MITPAPNRNRDRKKTLFEALAHFIDFDFDTDFDEHASSI